MYRSVENVRTLLSVHSVRNATLTGCDLKIQSYQNNPQGWIRITPNEAKRLGAWCRDVSRRISTAATRRVEYESYVRSSLLFCGCPDGQARIVSCCLSIEMNVLTDKTVLDVTVNNDLIFTLFFVQNYLSRNGLPTWSTLLPHFLSQSGNEVCVCWCSYTCYWGSFVCEIRYKLGLSSP